MFISVIHDSAQTIASSHPLAISHQKNATRFFFIQYDNFESYHAEKNVKKNNRCNIWGADTTPQ
ncbi:hypothetical protein CWC46_17415 [Prodigiosinella confusarubida]|uniref:Uncharacterized protein n=1 Tax=Serratia sp. (strain ATCC 39006) TaxID=104623 RepID=A0A2I5TMF4_SERS3|nr:hypothetical protein CWC46_17415 [Serratia sp. ATCC 39006]AUH05753.1 hypothetical protein Ser39006_017415 [Serratia sp. ATCC 39006]